MKNEFKVIWAQTAAEDLENIILFIAENSPDTALNILKKIKGKVSTLSSSPQSGRVVPELQDHGILIYRELIIPPWRVMFRISESKVDVLSVLDSRQNVEDILLKRLLKM